jgi:hypothetical protein
VLSSTDRAMSVISGGTAPNGLSAGGSSSSSAGSGAIVVEVSRLRAARTWAQRQRRRIRWRSLKDETPAVQAFLG